MCKVKHGDCHTRLYNIWNDIKQRCYNPTNNMFRYYGEKYIVISPDWEEFINFKNWSINNNYNDNFSLKRKNKDGDYEPDNCVWVSKSECCSQKINFKGKDITFAELSKKYDIPAATLRSRFYKGDKNNELIKPVCNRGRKRKIQKDVIL